MQEKGMLGRRETPRWFPYSKGSNVSLEATVSGVDVENGS
jgi:hypothetical protein